MRCCLLHVDLEAGGAERQLVQLARHWRQNDAALQVVLLEGKGVWLGELPPDVCLHSLSGGSPTGDIKKILWALRMVPRLRAFFQKHPQDVVLTFLWLPTLLAAIALRGCRNRPRLVWSVQSDVTQDFRLHRDGWIRGWLAGRFLPGQVDRFIAVSRGIRRKTQQCFHVSDECISVIPNGIDLPNVAEMANRHEAVPSRAAAVRLVSVGRLHAAKGSDVLLEALALVRKQSDDLECCILGEGSDRARLSQLADTLELDGCVKFLGYVSNPYAWMRAADIFVSPSSWETFGVAILEAMALGLPVVATATDGAVDLITDGVEGFLVPVGDPEALAGAILRLMKEPALRQGYGGKGKEKAQKFDARIIAKWYFEELKKMGS